MCTQVSVRKRKDHITAAPAQEVGQGQLCVPQHLGLVQRDPPGLARQSAGLVCAMPWVVRLSAQGMQLRPSIPNVPRGQGSAERVSAPGVRTGL